MPDATPLGLEQITINAGKEQILICFPCHDRTHASFSHNLAHLVGYAAASGVPIPGHEGPITISVQRCATSLLFEGRWRLVEDAKAKGCTGMLWLDTDMTFPPDALHMLMRHKQPIVGANYVSRRAPNRFTAATPKKSELGQNMEMLTTPHSTGLEPAGFVGFGCLYTDMKVFEQGPNEKPMFNFDWEWSAEQEKWIPVGEDVYCCRIWKERGFPLFVDQELSAVIGHIGEQTWTADELMKERFVTEVKTAMSAIEKETPEKTQTWPDLVSAVSADLGREKVA